MKKRKLVFLLPISLLLTGCANLSSDDFISKLVPDGGWPNFVAQLGALIVMIVVVLIFAYKPVKKIVEKRQNYIEENIRKAEEDKALAKENELKSQEMVLASTRTAADIVADAQKEAQKERNAILEQAALEAEQMRIQAENDIVRMEKEAQEEIRKEMVDVALAASKELLGREVDSDDNNRLIEEFIEDVKKE